MRLPAALLSARDLIVTLGIRLVPLFIMAGLTLVSFWFLQKNTQDEALLTPAKKSMSQTIFLSMLNSRF